MAATGKGMGGLTVEAVEDHRDRRIFVDVPWRVHAGDPSWIPPLRLDTKQTISEKNPYFRHASARFWTAFKDGVPVGRISAQIDRLYLELHENQTGFWGMLEAVDDQEVFEALFDAAAKWLAEQGMKRMLGPFNLSINQECGLLVQGHEHPPSFMMPQNPPYYRKRIEALGHRKAKDLLAYRIERSESAIEGIRKVLGRRFRDLATRPLDKGRLESELDAMFTIFNDAWSDNWGFVPFTRDEYLHLGRSMIHVVDPGLIRIAEMEGEPAGFIVLVPNLNEIIRDLNGRLLPFNWIRLLWRLKFHPFDSGRILLMGVVKKYRNSLAGAALSLCLIRDVMAEILETSMTWIELSWILEDNEAIRSIIEGLGARVYKTYRIFERELAGPAGILP